MARKGARLAFIKHGIPCLKRGFGIPGFFDNSHPLHTEDKRQLRFELILSIGHQKVWEIQRRRFQADTELPGLKQRQRNLFKFYCARAVEHTAKSMGRKSLGHIVAVPVISPLYRAIYNLVTGLHRTKEVTLAGLLTKRGQLGMAGLEVSYFAAAGGGLISFLSPCVLPLVPAYLCLIAGTSLEELTDAENAGNAKGINWRVVALSLIFVAGFSTVFVLLGASASYINRLIIEHLDILSKIAGAIIIIFGIHMTGLLRIPLLYREARFNDIEKPQNWFGAYVIGLAFGFGWTPCIGPILGTILAIAASESSLGYGVSLLGVYSLGLGIPFILAAFAINRFLVFMRGFRRYFKMIEIGTGVILIATGLLIFTGQFQILAYWFLELFPSLANLG